MQDFESIRPYRDDEVRGVVEALVRHPALLRGAAQLSLPRLARWLPGIAACLIRHPFQRRVRDLRSVHDVQKMVSDYFERMIHQTISNFFVTGLENLSPDETYLFISNHRDIALDSGLLSYALHQGGFATPRSAVGDNLFSEPVAAEFMRLNKSFVVERSARGAKAVYAALHRTSSYVRHSLETGHSVWIAQREGRSKDGFDRTDAALIKMLGLAYRDETSCLAEAIEASRIVPMSISYELDPNDWRKARELLAMANEGAFDKAADEDLKSIIIGITGHKGMVQLAFGEPLTVVARDAEAEDVALMLDRAIVGNLRVFPTHEYASHLLAQMTGGANGAADATPWPGARDDACDLLDEHLAQCSLDQRPHLLRQYANLLVNRQELGID